MGRNSKSTNIFDEDDERNISVTHFDLPSRHWPHYEMRSQMEIFERKMCCHLVCKMQTHHVTMSWTIFNFYRTLRNVFESDGAVEPCRGRSGNFVWPAIVQCAYVKHIIIKSSEPLSPDHFPRDARILSAGRCRPRLARSLYKSPSDTVKWKTQINT